LKIVFRLKFSNSAILINFEYSHFFKLILIYKLNAYIFDIKKNSYIIIKLYHNFLKFLRTSTKCIHESYYWRFSIVQLEVFHKKYLFVKHEKCNIGHIKKPLKNNLNTCYKPKSREKLKYRKIEILDKLLTLTYLWRLSLMKRHSYYKDTKACVIGLVIPFIHQYQRNFFRYNNSWNWHFLIFNVKKCNVLKLALVNFSIYNFIRIFYSTFTAILFCLTGKTGFLSNAPINMK